MRVFLLTLLVIGANTIAWAQEAGPGVAPALPEPPPPLSRNAILALAQAPADWSNLEALAEAAAHPDRALAAPASRAASELVYAIDVFDVDEREIPRGNLNAMQLRWLSIAANPDHWIDIRIYALDVASRLHRLQRQHGASISDAVWRAFLEDDDPEMRASALSLVPDAPGLASAAIPILIGDASEEVSLAAAQRLCGPLRTEASNLPTLDAPALSRLWLLATNRKLPITARAHLAPCLVADGSIESRRALGLLLQKSPPAMRRHLSVLVRKARTEPAQ